MVYQAPEDGVSLDDIEELYLKNTKLCPNQNSLISASPQGSG